MNREKILSIAGPLSDDRVAEIERLGAVESDLTQAVAWLARGTNVGRETRHSLTGIVGDLYEILAADLPVEGDRS